MKKENRRRSGRRHNRRKSSKYLQNSLRKARNQRRNQVSSPIILPRVEVTRYSLFQFFKKYKIFVGSLLMLILAVLVWSASIVFPQKIKTKNRETSIIVRDKKSEEFISKETTEVEESKEKPKSKGKSMAAKEAVMNEDLAYMDYLGLYYDYAHLSLEDTIKAFLAEQGLDASQVAFSYKNLDTGEVISLNETQPMTAGSTYKLPLSMLIIDEVEAGRIDMTEEVNYTTIENISDAPDYPLYLTGFGETINWTQILDNALIYSENTPAYIMADRLGGFNKAYQKISKFGHSKSDVKTIDYEGGNKTTSDYYIQVLDYLWKHKEKYAPVIERLDASFTNQWYEQYVNFVRVSQKPGYSQEALNVNAIVEEEVPYLISLYTAGFGGSNEETTEINGYGYYQVTCLAYVINEWHRVNMNPEK